MFDIPRKLGLRMTIAFSAFIIFMTGCMREESTKPEVVARVGDQVLTAGEVNAWEASLGRTEAPSEARSAYIRRWVEQELIYQDALKMGLDSDPWVARRMDELTRSLLMSRYMDQKTAKIAQPSLADVSAYFQRHSTEFVWPHLNLTLEYWQSSDNNSMNKLRAILLRGNKNDLSAGLMGGIDEGMIALSGADNSDPQVWKIVSGMKVGQVSQVVQLNDSYWIFKLTRRNEPGEQKGIEDVHDEIVARLMDEARSARREAVVRGLIEEYRREGILNWSNPTPTVAISKDPPPNDTAR